MSAHAVAPPALRRKATQECGQAEIFFYLNQAAARMSANKKTGLGDENSMPCICNHFRRPRA